MNVLGQSLDYNTTSNRGNAYYDDLKLGTTTSEDVQIITNNEVRLIVDDDTGNVVINSDLTVNGTTIIQGDLDVTNLPNLETIGTAGDTVTALGSLDVNESFYSPLIDADNLETDKLHMVEVELKCDTKRIEIQLDKVNRITQGTLNANPTYIDLPLPSSPITKTWVYLEVGLGVQFYISSTPGNYSQIFNNGVLQSLDDTTPFVCKGNNGTGYLISTINTPSGPKGVSIIELNKPRVLDIHKLEFDASTSGVNEIKVSDNQTESLRIKDSADDYLTINTQDKKIELSKTLESDKSIRTEHQHISDNGLLLTYNYDGTASVTDSPDDWDATTLATQGNLNPPTLSGNSLTWIDGYNEQFRVATTKRFDIYNVDYDIKVVYTNAATSRVEIGFWDDPSGVPPNFNTPTANVFQNTLFQGSGLPASGTLTYSFRAGVLTISEASFGVFWKQSRLASVFPNGVRLVARDINANLNTPAGGFVVTYTQYPRLNNGNSVIKRGTYTNTQSQIYNLPQPLEQEVNLLVSNADQNISGSLIIQDGDTNSLDIVDSAANVYLNFNTAQNEIRTTQSFNFNDDLNITGSVLTGSGPVEFSVVNGNPLAFCVNQNNNGYIAADTSAGEVRIGQDLRTQGLLISDNIEVQPNSAQAFNISAGNTDYITLDTTTGAERLNIETELNVASVINFPNQGSAIEIVDAKSDAFAITNSNDLIDLLTFDTKDNKVIYYDNGVPSEVASRAYVDSSQGIGTIQNVGTGTTILRDVVNSVASLRSITSDSNIDITLPDPDEIDIALSPFQEFDSAYQVTIPDSVSYSFRGTDGKNVPSFTDYLTMLNGQTTINQNTIIVGQLDVQAINPSGILYFANPSATNTIVWLAPGSSPQALLPTNQILAGTSLLRLPNETSGVLATQAYVQSLTSGGTILNTTYQANLGNQPYDVPDNIDIIFAQADSKNCLIRLPAAVSVADGRKITVKHALGVAPANNLNIILNGGTFEDGTTTKFITLGYQTINVVWSGTLNKWMII